MPFQVPLVSPNQVLTHAARAAAKPRARRALVRATSGGRARRARSRALVRVTLWLAEILANVNSPNPKCLIKLRGREGLRSVGLSKNVKTGHNLRQ